MGVGFGGLGEGQALDTHGLPMPHPKSSCPERRGMPHSSTTTVKVWTVWWSEHTVETCGTVRWVHSMVQSGQIGHCTPTLVTFFTAKSTRVPSLDYLSETC